MSFFLQVHRFHKQYVARLATVLIPYELSNSNWSLLQYVALNVETTTSQIAKYWDVEKPTVSANVKVMMQMELIQTTQGEDKREKYLSLTAKGQALYKDVLPQIESLQQSLLSTLSKQQQQLFQQALVEMELILKEELT